MSIEEARGALDVIRRQAQIAVDALIDAKLSPAPVGGREGYAAMADRLIREADARTLSRLTRAAPTPPAKDPEGEGSAVARYYARRLADLEARLAEAEAEDDRLEREVADLTEKLQFAHAKHMADAHRLADATKRIEALETGLKPEQVEWVVNDIAELGVKIGGQFFWLYKGGSLVYGTDPASLAAGVALNEDTDPPTHHMWRPVFKREFGECCHPVNYDDPAKWGTVSPDDSDEWKPLPCAILSPASEGKT